MELSIKQKNELLTGIILAQELVATIEQTRKFITVKSFEISDDRIKSWSKNVPTTFDNLKAKFIVKVYSIKIEYINLDVDEKDCLEYICYEDIYSFDKLYSVLGKYIDNPIE